MAGTSLKILVADDVRTNVRQIEVVARRLGHTTLIAGNGEEAVELFRTQTPDLVFMDIMMPGMDGISAVREIRSLPAEKWCPIILFSALDRMQDIVSGLECGADDYVVKPASLQLLRAKIRGFARLLDLQREVHDYSDELRNWRAQAEEQSRLGAHVMARLTDAEGLRDPLLRFFNIPAETFSGDLLCAARAPGDEMHLMLADAAGHGLPAALTAMPLTQAFYGMTAKGFPLPSIAEELNRKLKAILPADRFVAATLACLDVRNQTVEVWNGGNPDALFVDDAGRVVHRWASRHPPLGILPGPLFSGQTETVAFHEAGRLLLCSDGLAEAEPPGGGQLGLDGVLRLLGGAGPGLDALDALQRGVKAHLAAEFGRDDISCMMLRVPVERRHRFRIAAPNMPHAEPAAFSDWRLDLSYAARELRYLDVVPAVLGFITQIEVLRPHQSSLFLILSELFNNALDHGLLRLESSTKDRLGGFDAFMEQRQERLARLDDGQISLSFQLHQVEGEGVLDIRVHDSGPGFDYKARFENCGCLDSEDCHAYGRGIALVRALCSQLVYSGAGNKVWARYSLGGRAGAGAAA
ncbi:MAG: fused response regulator/phosphatase [Pseudomonadota bacterium]